MSLVNGVLHILVITVLWFIGISSLGFILAIIWVFVPKARKYLPKPSGNPISQSIENCEQKGYPCNDRGNQSGILQYIKHSPYGWYFVLRKPRSSKSAISESGYYEGDGTMPKTIGNTANIPIPSEAKQRSHIKRIISKAKGGSNHE